MILRLRGLARSIGIDRAIAYTVSARIIQALGGMVSIILISRFLNRVEQGYYFTFGSILAIQIFFELGLSNIIAQFAAHEKAKLDWVGEAELSGPAESLSHLSSLLHFCLKWFSITALLLLIILILAGYIFFSRYGQTDGGVNWQFPWIVICISAAFSLMISPILAFMEGLGKVMEVAKIRLLQQIIQISVLSILLIFGLKLFASPVAALVTFTIAPLWIFFSSNLQLLKFIWMQLGEWGINYKNEIFPYQWRIALSWISGYFIFQLFNPVLFATDGPVVAGQMGLTLAGLNGVLAVSLSWINTKVPTISSLIATKKFTELDSLFNRTLKQASVICGMCLLLFILTVFWLQFSNHSIGDRFLPIFPLILLAIATFVNQYVAALATYLRCHKEEPLLIPSIVLGLLTAASTFILGKIFGLNGIVIGYSALTVFVSLIWSLIIFKQKKEQWHQ